MELFLFSDAPKESVDTIFFHARAWEDDDNLFDLAASLYHTTDGYRCVSITINGGQGGPPGSTIGGKIGLDIMHTLSDCEN